MIKLFDVNPFAEAMLYYLGRANNERIAKRLAELIDRYPEHEAMLKKVTQPAITLEKMLNSELNVDDVLIVKFFKKFDSRKPDFPFGFCLASIMVSSPLTIHIEYSADEMAEYLRGCSTEERMFLLCFGITDKYEILSSDNCGLEEFSNRVADLQISIENKWKLINAAINYRIHLNELLSLIMPAAKLIEAAKDEYEVIMEEFLKRYSNDDAQKLFELYFGIKIEPIDIMNIVPMLFGFDGRFATISFTKNENAKEADSPAASPSEGKMFLGIARHITSKPLQDEITALSEKMQTLSDSTRLKILFYLCSNRAYGQELCSKFGLVPSALSYHISKLMASGFVATDLSGGKTYYTADKAGIQKMFDAFAEKIK